MQKEIIEVIGKPAALEQLAEECNELAHAALKYSRFLRGENPTPKSEEELKIALTEELADVEVCSTILSDDLINEVQFESFYTAKMQRWRQRLGINSIG